MNMMKHGFKNHIFSTKIVYFSALKSRALVDFSTVSLYQTKVQLPTGLWHFTRLKSGDPVGFQGLPAPAHTMAHTGCIYAQASWKLGAASWAASWKLRKFTELEAEKELKQQAKM